MAEKLSSTKAFNEAIKPFIDHKNAYQDYKGTTTAGDIPRTETQEKIENFSWFAERLGTPGKKNEKRVLESWLEAGCPKNKRPE